MIAARLTRTDADRNMARFYRVGALPDLFGGVQVIREWGRIGTRGQSMTHWCATAPEAAHLATTLLTAKLRRGYAVPG